jgi:hypothetical protein
MAHEFSQRVLDVALHGFGPFSGARELAAQVASHSANGTVDQQVESLVRREVAKSAALGFVTSIGGAMSIPIGLPTEIAASAVLNARLMAAIAVLYGYQPDAPEVRAAIVAKLGASRARGLLKRASIGLTNRLTAGMLGRLPTKMLALLNRVTGARLLRMVPLVGGAVGAAVEIMGTRGAAQAAADVFAPPLAAEPIARKVTSVA